MAPRPYQLGRRKEAADETRVRILKAARQLLSSRGGTGRFSVDEVARRAGVARMTVYYQFGSRRGLFEALFDDFASRGELGKRLAAAFQRADPQDILADVVAAFARFWNAGRPWIRRVRALGVLDLELGQALEDRNDRRRQVIRTVLDRLEADGLSEADRREELAGILYTLTSFETFDSLAGPDRSLEEVAPAVLRLARAAIPQP
jgi:AcrR family transcriptional regulator